MFTNNPFINISDEYGDSVPVTLDDYRELNPDGEFEIVGDEIREYYHEDYDEEDEENDGANWQSAGRLGFTHGSRETGYWCVVARKQSIL